MNNEKPKEQEELDKELHSLHEDYIKKRKSLANWLTYFSTIIAFTALIAGIFTFKDDFKNSISGNKSQTIGDTAIIFSQLNRVKNTLNELQNKINGAILINRDSLKLVNYTNTAFMDLKTQVADLNAKIQNLDKVILDNPEKAISIPLLRLQLDNQKDQTENKITSIKDDISRVYDMSKWIIGLVVGLLISILALNISSILSKNK